MMRSRALWLALATLAGLVAPLVLPILGLVLLSIGCAMAWSPLGCIVPGALLLADHVGSRMGGGRE